MSVPTLSERAAAAAESEIRTFTGVRVEVGDDRRIKGHAIVFNSRSENLGGWVEVIRPEAVDRTLREALDVRALVDHDSAKVLGRTKSGTLVLKKDRKGLFIDVDPPRTSYARDLIEVVDRGDVSGMSFRFRTMPEGVEWDIDEDTGLYVRYVLDMRIEEVSIVTFPAYSDTDVTVAKRSLEAFMAQQGNSRVDQLRRKLRTTLAR